MARITTAALISLSALAVVSADSCSNIEKTAPSIGVASAYDISYATVSNDYWSTSCAALKPACVVFPSSSLEVAAIINILNGNSDNFAVKSGGHNANNHFSSTKGGPLISTKNLNHVLLDNETGIVQIGPGLRWDEVADELNGSGWCVVGGRIGNVGVGGFMLGGGLSFMSQEYGWAASSVLEYEIVLANGTITTASVDNNPDLFKALKGGGNNFGIVTSYTVQAYQQGYVYGGVLSFVHSTETDTKLLRAIRDFTKYNTDSKAAIIPTAERVLARRGPITDTCKTRTFSEFVTNNNWAVLKDTVYNIGTETIPLPADDNINVLEAVHAHWRNVTDSVLLVGGLITNIAYQPLPRRIAQIAQDRGGDLLDFDVNSDFVILEISNSFLLQSDYDMMDITLQAAYNGVRQMVLAWQEDGTLDKELNRTGGFKP
ncbi:FAD dependent oxidoreductase [Grosmannia clavigera kw1407]|uniref:FAD dependent oxidoreductase n=1 Tax=Grosmannia clavigera (strain kw1407 / UAMH 11150) TaxID=655863 RepID=F0XF70_GROCL|nr:FAD dependent oxidoreductase [Grosmannia clavigera kw1407]EFX04313.1 FAD dependent oxidoreductase [Grosmannia clavigera kw1407]